MAKNQVYTKSYHPYHSLNDPCPDPGEKHYSTPPHLYMGFQPEKLPQFTPKEALQKGTLWPALYDPYEKNQKLKG
ncbi:spore coat protein JA [Fictibacillus solisalsi]|uniref:Spore coat protein JA n=1 Tax=Fictibacillus solisalsi TaxID=459525 RepID=A0A1H0ATX7_9BACL|nr:spore coat associated protein CotJA [Fictibacillus solisalsi]SDN36566.1 spore coat protein JA [Fictibacillus solisalsi]